MLPKLELPSYPITTPVSEAAFRVRPYTNREERTLMILKESNTEATLVDAIAQLVESCSIDMPKPARELPLADLLWTFIRIRSYSIGEISELNYRCTKETGGKKCGGPIHYELNLNDIEVINNEKLQDIDLGSGVKLRLRYYTANDILNDPDDKREDAEVLYDMVECIYTSDEVNEKKDIPLEEFVDWYQDIPRTKQVEIEKFLAHMPMLQVKLKLKCPKCGNESELVLDSITDFFQ